MCPWSDYVSVCIVNVCSKEIEGKQICGDCWGNLLTEPKSVEYHGETPIDFEITEDNWEDLFKKEQDILQDSMWVYTSYEITCKIQRIEDKIHRLMDKKKQLMKAGDKYYEKK